MVSHFGIEDDDHLSHDGDHSHFTQFAVAFELLIKGFHVGIKPDCRQSGDEQGVPDLSPAACNHLFAAHLPAVAVLGSHSNEFGDLAFV
ncbi:hypothetical protein PsW64_00572 [Pseudovibrio sp. W64]|nr:hypothetical protein PsW64_00572 [Pseudovibrio sp. W64]